MKETRVTPHRDVSGKITGYTVNEYGSNEKRSIEEIQNERAGRKILTEMTDKAFKPVMILGIVAIIAEIVVGIVYMIKNYGVKATFDSIVDCVTMIVSELFIAEFIDENGNIEVIVWIILILLIINIANRIFKRKKSKKK